MSLLSRLFHWLAVRIDPSQRRKREDAERRDKTVAFIHAGIVATLIIWGYIAVVTFLAQEGNILISYKDVWLILLTAVLGAAALGSWREARESGKRALRAYLGIISTSAFYQDEHFVFEAKPKLLNTGQTPAYNVSYWMNASVEPTPLKDDFPFTMPEDGFKHSAVLGRDQSFVMNRMIDRIPTLTLDEVKAIKIAKGAAFHAWGCIAYDDIFGDRHETEFSVWLTWAMSIDPADGKAKEMVSSFFTPRHNRAD
jgi:hypothetical protein